MAQDYGDREHLQTDAARIAVIIPVLNEEDSIGRVINDIPAELNATVIVADNGSVDGSMEAARRAGAIVVREEERGYGAACLRGMLEAARHDPDIIVFLDGDYSDFPGEMPLLIEPILHDDADMVIGSRVRGRHEQGALLPQARFGNWLSTRLIKLFWRIEFTDLGPFRSIRWPALQALGMADRNYGWTVEMQIKAAKHGLQCREVPVSYRKRIGVSKVTGTIQGAVKAGVKILWTIALHVFSGLPRS